MIENRYIVVGVQGVKALYLYAKSNFVIEQGLSCIKDENELDDTNFSLDYSITIRDKSAMSPIISWDSTIDQRGRLAQYGVQWSPNPSLEK